MSRAQHKKNLSQRYEVKQLRAIEKLEDDINAAVCAMYKVDDISLTPLDLNIYKLWEQPRSERFSALQEAFSGIPDSDEKDKIFEDALKGLEEADSLGTITALRKEMA